TVVAALGGGIVDLEQRFGLGPADWLMLDRSRGQNTRAPGHVMGIQRPRKMHSAPRGGTLPGDDAITNNGQCQRSSIPAGNLGGLDSADGFGVGNRGRHWYSSHFSCSGPAFSCGRKRLVNDSKLRSRVFWTVADWSLISRLAGRGKVAGRSGNNATSKRHHSGNQDFETITVFSLSGHCP